MKRKVFLVVALFALMAVGVYAQSEADFDFKDGQITDYKGSATVVKIPEKIKNVPVNDIGSGAFSNNDKITSVTIPNGVIYIRMDAFSDCTKLSSINIPNGVKLVDDNAFSGCASLTSINIPDSVTSIGARAFQNCTKLASVTIGSGVTKIGASAFNRCTSLTSVTFSGSIPSSGFNANVFNGLGDIRDKYLDASVGAGTYTRPDGKSLVWTKGASTTAAPTSAGTPGLAFALTRDGKGYSVSKGTVKNGDVVIPASYNNLPVTEIANFAFESVPDIKSVIIPNSVTIIGQRAFAMCIYLKIVTLGSGVKEIGTQAFQNCQDLTSVTFQSTISSDGFNSSAEIPGDLRAKYLAANGGIGTYTRPERATTWTKK